MMVDACHPSTWEVETEGSGAQGHPQQLSMFNASLDYMLLITVIKSVPALLFWVWWQPFFTQYNKVRTTLF